MRLTQAILPVAGLGTRFLPWTKVMPKEMLPIGNEPIIAKLVDECLSVGISDVCFVINEGKELLPKYFEKNARLEAELERRGKSDALKELSRYDAVRFNVVYQKQQLGDGHAILQAADWVQSDHIAVLFGDDLVVDPVTKEQTGLPQLCAAMDALEDAERAKSAMLCLQNVEKERVSKYGIAELDGAINDSVHRITGLVEKPSPDEAPSTLAIVGKYIIPRSTIGLLEHAPSSHGGEIRLIDALITGLGEGTPIFGCQFTGARYDTGYPEGYKEAVKMLG